jgi:hypothetical protein
MARSLIAVRRLADGLSADVEHMKTSLHAAGRIGLVTMWIWRSPTGQTTGAPNGWRLRILMTTCLQFL